MNTAETNPQKGTAPRVALMVSLLVASLVLFSVTSAAIPKLLSIQGKLTDASKNPLTGIM